MEVLEYAGPREYTDCVVCGLVAGAWSDFAAIEDVRACQRVHNEFHEVFLRACGNEKLFQLVRSLVQQFQRFRLTLSVTGNLKTSINQHRSIVKAFEARDADLAERLVRENAYEGAETLIHKVMEPTGTGGGARARK